MRRDFVIIDLVMLPLLCVCAAIAYDVGAAALLVLVYLHGLATGAA